LIIKLLEQPIIAINEAEVAGTVDGVIIKGNKVSCIYHKNMENQFAIPVESVTFGENAVMIQDLSVMALASKNAKVMKSLLDIYNKKGKHLGLLTEIEVDSQYTVRYLHTDEYKIELSKVISYEDIVVVDMEAAEDKPEAEVSMAIGPEIEWEEEQHEEEKAPESSELSVVRNLHQSEEKEKEKEAVPGVDPKYAYLCGKQLLEGIDIDSTFYEKGTVIGPEMIKHAIASNAIVKVIVNAED
jgi:sporulation protein YlmC with PRC-barrel domain